MMTTACMDVTMWHLSARVWLGWMMTLHSVSAGVLSSYNGWLNWYGMQPQQQSVWSHHLLHMLPCLDEGLGGLLMVHVIPTLVVKVWRCSMTCIQADPQSFIVEIQPKIVGLYASIYRTENCIWNSNSNWWPWMVQWLLLWGYYAVLGLKVKCMKSASAILSAMGM